MLIFINYKNAKFCQITLRIKIFIHKRKVVPFFLPRGVCARRAYSIDGPATRS